jgi:hypothetical protein
MKSFINSRKLFRNPYLLLLITVLLACHGGKADPASAVKSFLISVDKHEFDEAELFVTENYKPLLQNMKNVAASMPVRENKYNYILEEKGDSTATVTVVYEGNTTSFSSSFYLVKKKGRWLIDRHRDK